MAAYIMDKETLNNVRSQAVAMVPSIPFNQVIRVFAGTRPTPSTHDFVIGYAKSDNHFINASGIESPGLVSSPAIAEYVVDELLAKVIPLKKKENWSGKVRPRINPKALSNEERNKLIQEHPEYGTIVCNCEKVTLGEILDELNRSVPPQTIKAMKKRTRAGFGKCQGGFCQFQVMSTLAKHYHCDLSEILLDANDSNICRYATKGEKK